MTTKNVFYEQSGATISSKLVDTSPTWASGPWISAQSELARYVSVGYTFDGTTLPTKLEAKVEISNDNGDTNHGPLPVIDSISGVVTIVDGIFVLPITTGYHRFDFSIRTNQAWRVSFRKETGDATTAVLAHADVDILS